MLCHFLLQNEMRCITIQYNSHGPRKTWRISMFRLLEVPEISEKPHKVEVVEMVPVRTWLVLREKHLNLRVHCEIKNILAKDFQTKKSHLLLLHPWRLTWNIIMEVWKIIFLSKWVICMFHVNLPGCTWKMKSWSIVLHPFPGDI